MKSTQSVTFEDSMQKCKDYNAKLEVNLTVLSEALKHLRYTQLSVAQLKSLDKALGALGRIQ